MKDISEYTNELYKRIDEKTEALGKRPLFKLRGKDNDSSEKEVRVMSVRRKSLIIVTIVLIGAIVLGATFVVSGRMSIKDPNPERASDPDKEWIGNNEAPNNYDFVKENVQDVTYRIDGKDMVFTYVKSTCTEFDKEFCLDENMGSIVVDYYDSAEGYTVTKYEGKDRLIGFFTNDYSTPRGDENSTLLAKDQVRGRAEQIIENSDMDISGAKNAEYAIRDEYWVTVTFPKEIVYMNVDILGSLRNFSIRRFADITEERKQAAREKLRERIEELKKEKEKPKLNYDFEEEFVMMGDEDYAMFTVTLYEEAEESASYVIPYDVIGYFCTV